MTNILFTLEGNAITPEEIKEKIAIFEYSHAVHRIILDSNKLDRSGNAITNIDVLSAVMVAEKILDRDGVEIDITMTDRIAMIDALVLGNVLTSEDKTDLLSLADKTGSRAEELGIVDLGEEIFMGHIIQAKAMIE